MLPTGLSMPMWSSEPSQTLVLIFTCNTHCMGGGCMYQILFKEKFCIDWGSKIIPAQHLQKKIRHFREYLIFQ